MEKTLLFFIFMYASFMACKGHLTPDLLKPPCKMGANNFKKFLELQIHNYAHPDKKKLIPNLCERITPLQRALENYGRFQPAHFPSLPPLSDADFLTVVETWEKERTRIKNFFSPASSSTASTTTKGSTSSEQGEDWSEEVKDWAFFTLCLCLLLFFILQYLWKFFNKVCRYE